MIRHFPQTRFHIATNNKGLLPNAKKRNEGGAKAHFVHVLDCTLHQESQNLLAGKLCVYKHQVHPPHPCSRPALVTQQ